MAGWDDNEEKKPETPPVGDGLIPEPPVDKPAEAKDDLALPPEPGVPEPEPGAAAMPPAAPEEPLTKSCVFCGSEIGSAATRCAHCAAFLPIAEGTAYKQYFLFLFSCLALVIGCLLPWERSSAVFNLRGIDSIGGGLILVFAAYGVLASFWNIYHRKMIVWPVLIAAIEGALFGWSRVMKIIPTIKVDVTGLTGFSKTIAKFKGNAGAFGPGLYLVVIFSTIVILAVFYSVFAGAKQDAKRKAEARAQSQATRSSRRKS
jgi:hypothetical protein